MSAAAGIKIERRGHFLIATDGVREMSMLLSDKAMIDIRARIQAETKLLRRMLLKSPRALIGSSSAASPARTLAP